MTVRPIRTEDDYEAALARIAELMDAAPDSDDADELDVLATLAERYEDEHEPVPPPDPIDAVLFRLEQAGRPTQDLRDILGVRRNRVSEILNRKRRLSLDMIRKLSEELDIPAEVLIQTEAEPEADKAPPAQSKGRRRRRPKGSGGEGSRREPAAGRSPSVRPKRESHDLPDIVDAHLRAERDLDPDAAATLGQMFRLAYEQFAKQSLEGRPSEGGSGDENGPHGSTPS